jgi:DNA-directed RNA polymerase specialized sigma24 family protein
MMDDQPRRVTTSFLGKLTAIAQDPSVRALAWRRAGTPELAEDALQETFYAVARTRDPASIRDLRAFFCKTLIHEINHQSAHPTPLAEDFCTIPDRYRDHASSPAAGLSADFESELHNVLQVEEWLTRLRKERNKLAASVPRRSTDPSRYRTAIIAAAEKILRMVTEGNVDAEDWSAILKSEYPEWFDEPDALGHVSARRVQDARKDARTLFQALVQREHEPRQPSRLGLIHSFPARPYLIEPLNERARTADDTILSALFLKAEQTLLPHEMSYNLEEGLQMFTEWLNTRLA